MSAQEKPRLNWLERMSEDVDRWAEEVYALHIRAAERGEQPYATVYGKGGSRERLRAMVSTDEAEVTQDTQSAIRPASLLEVAERELSKLQRQREQQAERLKELEGQAKAARLDLVWTDDGISRLKEEIQMFKEASRAAKTGKQA